MAFQRTASSANTFGMLPRVAQRARARAAGTMASATGRHAGGPCPAVCLSTLTGWTYAATSKFLARFGFKGAGMCLPEIADAYRQAMGQHPELHRSRGLTTAQAVDRYFAGGKSGCISNRGHIMPVLNGRLLNASAEHRARVADSYMIFDIA